MRQHLRYRIYTILQVTVIKNIDVTKVEIQLRPHLWPKYICMPVWSPSWCLHRMDEGMQIIPRSDLTFVRGVNGEHLLHALYTSNSSKIHKTT